MTREELFRKNFPEYCRGEECLSPYFDLFCAGIEIATEENYTIEQKKIACEKCIDSDREIDCGKCDVQKELEQQHYRQFKDTAELILHYEKHFNIEFPSFYEPMMWVKAKDESDVRFFVTSFSEHYVKIDGEFVSMKKLFEDFVFLDNSPCGSKEE